MLVPLLATTTDTIVGGLIAAAAGLVASLTTGALSERSRRNSERSARRERAATAVGRTLSLLRDMYPETILLGAPVGFRGDEDEFVGRTLYEELWPRWEPLQDELEIVAVADLNEGVRQEADALVQGVRRTLADIQFYGVKRAEDGVEPIMDEGEREQVKTRYDETKAHGQRLAIAIQNVG